MTACDAFYLEVRFRIVQNTTIANVGKWLHGAVVFSYEERQPTSRVANCAGEFPLSGTSAVQFGLERSCSRSVVFAPERRFHPGRHHDCDTFISPHASNTRERSVRSRTVRVIRSPRCAAGVGPPGESHFQSLSENVFRRTRVCDSKPPVASDLRCAFCAQPSIGFAAPIECRGVDLTGIPRR